MRSLYFSSHQADSNALPRTVIELVCRRYLVSRDELLSRARLQRFIWPRCVAAALLYDRGCTTARIAEVLQRHHANVQYSLRRVQEECSAYARSRADLAAADAELGRLIPKPA